MRWSRLKHMPPPRTGEGSEHRIFVPVRILGEKLSPPGTEQVPDPAVIGMDKFGYQGRADHRPSLTSHILMHREAVHSDKTAYFFQYTETSLRSSVQNIPHQFRIVVG
jgi:hypothetical protein